MSVWQRHAERIRRQQRGERFDRWCQAHPWGAWFLFLGIAIAIGEIALLLRYAVEFLTR